MKANITRHAFTRRHLLAQAGMAGIALATAPAWADALVQLPFQSGPTERPITTAFPQKGAMILQRSRPPLLETPFEVFDKGVFTVSSTAHAPLFALATVSAPSPVEAKAWPLE